MGISDTRRDLRPSVSQSKGFGRADRNRGGEASGRHSIDLPEKRWPAAGGTADQPPRPSEEGRTIKPFAAEHRPANGSIRILPSRSRNRRGS